MQSTKMFMHFNKQGSLIFISSRITEDFKKKIPINLNSSSAVMSFQEIFEKCPDISKAIQNFELS